MGSLRLVVGLSSLPENYLKPALLSQYRNICQQAKITRISELTGLDCLNIPVWSCSRPDALLWQVSAGKGITHESAITSAIFEAVETYAAESWLRRPETIEDLSESAPTIPKEYIESESRKLLGYYEKGLRIETEPCINALELKSFRNFSVPLCWGYLSVNARMHGYVTNGLSSSLAFPSAMHHALCEIYERHIISSSSTDGKFSFKDFHGLPRMAVLNPIFSLVKRACGTRFECIFLYSVSSVVPLVWCLLHDKEAITPNLRVNFGSKCSNRIEEAMIGSFTEACQQRLSQIQGAREDLPELNIFEPWPDIDKVIYLFQNASLRETSLTKPLSASRACDNILSAIPGPVFCINLMSGLQGVSTVKLVAPLAKFTKDFF